MKVKTIGDVDPDKLDEKTNEWLRTNQVKVVHTNTATGRMIVERKDQAGKLRKEEHAIFLHSIWYE